MFADRPGLSAALTAALVISCGACGRLHAVKDKLLGHHDQGHVDQPKPGEATQLIAVDQDVDAWADDAIRQLQLPAADGTSAKPQDSCENYYDGMLSYAKAMQAIYIKRYLAWGRFQLAHGGFQQPLIYNQTIDEGGLPADDSAKGSAVDAAAPMAESAASTSPAANSTVTAGATASPNDGASPTAPDAVASEYETNNRTEGVDETDYVKSNGRYVFVANGNLLRVFDLNGKIVNAAQIVNETSRGLHLAGSTLVLITTSTKANPYPQPLIQPVNGGDWWAYWNSRRQRLWYYAEMTNVHEFHIEDDGSLTPTTKKSYVGSFRDGREIDGTLHIVMQKQLPWNILQTGLDANILPAYAQIHSNADLIAYARRAAAENLNSWRQLMFEEGDLMADARASYQSGHCQAFTRLTSTTADAIDGGQLVKLYKSWDSYLGSSAVSANVFGAYPVFPTYNYVTTVASIDLAGQRPDGLGLAISPVNPSMIYASQNHLVVGNQRYQWINYWQRLYVLPVGINASQTGRCLGSAELCAVFGTPAVSGVVPVQVVPVATFTSTTNFFDFLTFDLTPDGATPSGIGTVAGTPLSEYAIDAGPTTLRLVVTENNQTTLLPGGVQQVFGGGAVTTVTRTDNVSKLKVLQNNGGEWTVAADLPLAVDGTVSAVRFLGNAAFVATSSGTQALYAVDLSNELAPRLAGAMPDVMRSTYFHPMEDGKTLLALGREGGALTVAMVDIENLDAPQVLAKTELDFSGSQAEYDFKSFRFIPRLGLLVLPLTSPLRLDILAANRDSGFAHYGTVSLQDKLTATYGFGGSPRTMLFDDLLVGVFGNQDVGANLGYSTHAPQLQFAKDLNLVYRLRSVDGGPMRWFLDDDFTIEPKWRSATLLQ